MIKMCSYNILKQTISSSDKKTTTPQHRVAIVIKNHNIISGDQAWQKNNSI